MSSMTQKRFGTAPVFFTAISTILGAILFLRFGFAVGVLGFWGVVLIIMLGHMVTLPTAFALSEIATNKRVEGGGEYFIISRSFGLNIGATIGIALFLSQAVSVAFYIIAFTEAFEFLFNYFRDAFSILLPRQVISIPAVLVLGYLILKKGANIGVRALYLVAVVLGVSLVLFFLGSTPHAEGSTFNLANAEFRNTRDFFLVFAIVFPAFTGMTAGVGLSGDLKKPSVSIPRGTTIATFAGMVIYLFVVYKLAYSASPEDLTEHQLIMAKIAIGGAFVIPLGLAASTVSSAIGSVLVAPRTLQALAADSSLPSRRINSWLSKGKGAENEPNNASIITLLIALITVALGNVNAIAEVISMFFMVTYGSLCLISFLNHFGSSPSYRPSFRSRWWLSLLGFLVSVWVMFKINTPYAFLSIALMTLIYLWISNYHKERGGLESIFANAIFQINRNLQVFLQKVSEKRKGQEWRPSAICISENSFTRDKPFKLLSWISFRYGFGTYLHRIEGYYSKTNVERASKELSQLIRVYDDISNHVYIDTLVSPSYTSAIAQSIQVPGVAGMENNMVIFEFDKESPDNLADIIDNFSLVKAGKFDVCILAASMRDINFKGGIHVWIRSHDTDNANLMILLSFIISSHPDWKKSSITVFDVCKPEDADHSQARLRDLIISGRLPISEKNIEVIIRQPDVSSKDLVNRKSKNAGLTIIGFREESLRHDKEKVFQGYDGPGTLLFVHSQGAKVID